MMEIFGGNVLIMSIRHIWRKYIIEQKKGLDVKNVMKKRK